MNELNSSINSKIEDMKKDKKELLEIVLRNEYLIIDALNIEIPKEKIEYKPLVKTPSRNYRINEKSGVVPVRGTMN